MVLQRTLRGKATLQLQDSMKLPSVCPSVFNSTVFGFPPANKRQCVAISLIRLCCWWYDNPCVSARWKEGERTDFSVTQQACGECHMGFGKRHYPASAPGCTSASALLRCHPPDICSHLCFPPGPISCCQLLRGRKSSVYFPGPWGGRGGASDLLSSR